MRTLVLWENTEDYRIKLDSARERWSGIYRRMENKGFVCTCIGGLRFDMNEEPEVWLNDNRPLMADRECKGSSDAERMALRHGRCGWWSLDDLEKFSNGWGPMFNEAMWDLGYRRSKRDQTKWARRRNGDDGKEPYKERWEKKQAKEYLTLDEDEEERLRGLLIFPPESEGLGRTYNISVGKTGMIYVALLANPMAGSTAETLGEFGAQLNSRAHIARDQEGFCIEAKNVRLGDQEGIYVKARRTDESYVESVWPSEVPDVRINELLRELPERMSLATTAS